MSTSEKTVITVETLVNVSPEKAWKLWTTPADITQWNFAIDTWHCPKAENDLQTGGKFSCTMAAKDGSMQFEFGGVYDEVKINELIAYTMSDERKVKVTFVPKGNSTQIVESFEAESQNSIEMQQQGWQAILNNFKQYAEAKS